MSHIMFFCIPAHGHFNPTVEVVKELVKRGHYVKYYLTSEFQQKIEDTQADFISIDDYMPPAPEDLDQKVGKDFASLIEMVADTTLSLESFISKEIKEFHPDCIVSDSLCFWGKLFAKKYQIPFICSTTSIAFNQYTARLMKQGFKEMFLMLKGMPRINRKIKLLNQHDYHIDNFVSIIQNDNETNTIVYTSRQFQPMVETFSDRYLFVGPSLNKCRFSSKKKDKPLIYISLGTVLNQNIPFYKQCIEALKDEDYDIVMSVGKDTDISQLEPIPSSFHIFPRVNQLEVLSNADAFLTHCGMNSVNESLYYGVPMVLFPQHSEENAVAICVENVEAGLRLKKPQSSHIKKAINDVIMNKSYKKNAEKMSYDFQQYQADKMASDFIEKIIQESKKM